MSAVRLPKALEEKFGELADQFRRLWFIRGVSRLALLTVLSAGGLILLESQCDLTSIGRTLLLIGWLVLFGLGVWRFVVRPLRAPIPVAALAATIEDCFPSLAERLMTLVDLSETADAGNGSQALIEVLAKDTAQRTRRLNFVRALPTVAVLRLAVLAVIIGVAALLPLVFVGGSGERVRQFLLPWYAPRVETPFTIVVSSGSPVIKRGDSVTLTAFLEKKKPDAVLPETATLIYRDATGEKKLPMTGDDRGTYHVTRPAVTADFEYCVTAGPASSDWHPAYACDPVELAAGSSVRIAPPPYAVPPRETVSLNGLPDVEVLQHSQLHFDLRYSRPVTVAYFEWKPAVSGVVDGERFQLRPTPGNGGSAEWTAIADGTLKLILTGDRGLKTEIPVSVRALVDQPPAFEKAVGIGSSPKEVRPDEKLVLDLTITDDVRVEGVQLEYTLTGKEPATVVSIPLKGLGTRRAEGRFTFDLAGKAKEGETIRYRVRAFDNRSVPEARLGPQFAVVPESGWSQVRINSMAESLDRQEVVTLRDAIRKALEAAKADTEEARREVETVRRESAGQPMLTPDQTARLQAARDKAAAAARAIDEVAREAARTPELRPLADKLREVAEAKLPKADAAIRKAEHEPTAKGRDASVADAKAKLDEVVEALTPLPAVNDGLAQNQLARRRLEKLADVVNRLAAEAATATDPKTLADLNAKLQRAKDELREVVNGTDALRNAGEATANDAARALADETKRLAEAQKDLEMQIAAADEAARKSTAAGVAATQKDLALKADALRRKTAEQTRVAGTDPLDSGPAVKAAEQAANGNRVAAMTEQEKAARDLDRVANALDQAANARKDPRDAARQLATAQDDLRAKAAEATPDTRARMAGDQDALRAAAEKLDVPPADAQAKVDAVNQLKKAAEALMRNDTSAAEPAMKKAAASLRKLADTLPGREQRLKKSLEELDTLQREQHAIQREAEDKLKPFEKRAPNAATRKEAAEKLAETARKQAAIAEKLDGLDAPGLTARRDRTTAAARHAADDLAAGLPQDVPASQQETGRRIAQLRQALDGRTPGDELADDLAKKQAALADAVDAAAGKPDEAARRVLTRLQREIADKLGGVSDPNAAERLNRVKEAARAAAEELAKPDNPDELRKKARIAARDLDDLADHLAGVEAEADRVERLARERQAKTETARRNGGKPVAPDEASAAQSDLERDLDDLKRTRVGTAQEAKKAAVDQLERLKRTPNAERTASVQKSAADALRTLADELKKKPESSVKGNRPAPEGDASANDAGGQLPSKADAATARDLAKQQREARDQLAKADAPAKPDAAAAGKAQQAKQGELARQAEALAKKLDNAGNAEGSKADPAAMAKAADAARTAGAQMARAGREEAADRKANAAEARQKAGEAMAKAAEQTARAAGPADPNGKPDPNARVAAKAADAAGDLLTDAKRQANTRAPAAAEKSLKDAADKLADAAGKLGQGAAANANDGLDAKPPPPASDLPADVAQYLGKPWGDLPGDVKSKVIQDLKAKYGEDYARVIKLYFEQIAEKK